MQEGGGGLSDLVYIRHVVVEVGVQAGVQPENPLVAGLAIVKGLREPLAAICAWAVEHA